MSRRSGQHISNLRQTNIVKTNNQLREILEELKLLGEEQRRNNERKERRRETKTMIQREILKQNQHNEMRVSQNYISDEEQLTLQPSKPVYVRRRLNLLGK